MAILLKKKLKHRKNPFRKMQQNTENPPIKFSDILKRHRAFTHQSYTHSTNTVDPKNHFPKIIGEIISRAFGSKHKVNEVCIDESMESTPLEQMFKELKFHSSNDGTLPKAEVKVKNSKISGLSRIFSKKNSNDFKENTDYKQNINPCTITEDNSKEDSSGEMELCKKRILMGERCWALTSSGVLHYDEDGVLIPQDIFTK